VAPSPAYLVKDLQQKPLGSAPRDFTVSGGSTYFVAKDGARGDVLWKVTAGAAPEFVAAPYPGGSNPRFLTDVNGTLYFMARTSATEEGLYKTDGTPAGTVRVFPVTAPRALMNVNGTLFFASTDAVLGSELWKSDGTTQGTVLVKDINPSGGSFPGGFTAVGGTLLFTADDGVHGLELWKTDGTEPGTVLVKDIYPGVTSGSAFEFKVVGNVAYFKALGGPAASLGFEPWKTDGTEQGTVMVKDINPTGGSFPSWFTAVGNTVFFTATLGSSRFGLFKTDGTEAGTELVYAGDPVGNGLNPQGLVELNGKLLFTGADQANGRELWTSDGTTAGTAPLKPVATADVTTKPVVYGGRAYFAMNDGQSGTELWVTDGTAPGTQLLKDIAVGAAGSNPVPAFATGGRVYLVADDGVHGAEPWVTDGTANATALLGDLHSGTDDNEVSDIVRAGSTTYFVAYGTGDSAASLWKTDGTAAGTVRLLQGTVASPRGLAAGPGGTLLFSFNDGVHGTEPWVSDGTAAGTVLLKDVHPGAGHSAPESFRALGNAAYFKASDGVHGVELWKTDGTAQGTSLVVDFDTDGNESADAMELVATNGKLFFTRSGLNNWTGLVVSNGTAAGTVAVPAPLPSGEDTYVVGVMNGAAYVTVYNVNGFELWKTDGTTSTFLANVRGSLGLDAGGLLYFSGDDGVNGSEPWRTDGTPQGTRMLKDIYPGHNSDPWGFTALNGMVYFSAWAQGSGTELWKTDGTEQGTVLFMDLEPGADSGDPHIHFANDGLLVFTASTSTGGTELWRTDGTPQGTAQVADIAPGQLDAMNSETAVLSGDTIFFEATDRQHGEELWAVKTGDLWAPVITCPAPAPVEATAASTPVTFSAMATAPRGTDPVIAYSVQPGSGFPVGTTRVEATATYPDGGGSLCAFDVTVVDTTAPAVSHADMTVEATGAGGAEVTFQAEATDAVDGTLQATCTPVSGSTFALGSATTVTCSATDAHGNAGSGTFTVQVLDTTAPVLTCPSDVVITDAEAAGAPVQLPAPSVTDAVTASPTLTVSHDSGLFPVGTTNVNVSAADAAGNTAQCTYKITVEPKVISPSPGGCGCQAGSSSELPWMALLGLGMLPLLRRLRRVAA
jgi:MYXO-CTERM domain-containing protein